MTPRMSRWHKQTCQVSLCRRTEWNHELFSTTNICVLYSVHCTLYRVPHARARKHTHAHARTLCVCVVLYTVNNVHYTVYNVHYLLYMHIVRRIMHALYTIHCTLRTRNKAHCRSTVYCVDCILDTISLFCIYLEELQRIYNVFIYALLIYIYCHA